MSALTPESARTLSEFLKVYTQPQRLLILDTLLRGERAVSDIESQTGVTQPTLSQQLATLRRAGVIVARRKSRAIFYALASDAETRRVRLLLGVANDASLPADAGSPYLCTASSPRRESGASFARVHPLL
ncbi:helix-turn-helix transcriptional regulator [Acetobacter sacchari]|uniref:Helix-turn-helix transcriptional regulator n=1 Tax=Acetobacter sacchari TaxID=2661687 RepID=A0ABS3LXF3_9PROT|nr:metalloregulator ArsR/SmtB family transcription factor [Acetobacter sacchari]MBO1360580.1 helix-turn-helix transcriptional regulator [Acetobacter sacchari]